MYKRQWLGDSFSGIVTVADCPLSSLGRLVRFLEPSALTRLPIQMGWPDWLTKVTVRLAAANAVVVVPVPTSTTASESTNAAARASVRRNRWGAGTSTSAS